MATGNLTCSVRRLKLLLSRSIHLHRRCVHTWSQTQSKTTMKRKQPPGSNPVNIHLYSDDNPATTTKGTGFKDKETALRTIELTEQNKPSNKRIWTINTMLHRAKNHPHQTQGMRDAIEVFEAWVSNYKKNKEKEQKLPKSKTKPKPSEILAHDSLKQSASNAHSFDSFSDPQAFLKQARQDIKEANENLRSVAKVASVALGVEHESSLSVVCFCATFGGPGTHGYGTHEMEGSQHALRVRGNAEVAKIFGKKDTKAVKEANVHYDEATKVLRVTFTACTQEKSLLQTKLSFSSKEGASTTRSVSSELVAAAPTYQDPRPEANQDQSGPTGVTLSATNGEKRTDAHMAEAGSMQAMKAQYLRLTKEELPELAKRHKWVLRLDHCFQRVVLDNTCGGCWYDTFDQRRGAVHQMTRRHFQQALAIANQLAEDKSGALLRELNDNSLRWRGKKPRMK